MLWRLQSFPVCSHHVFLSHCREDREWLIFPLYEALRQKGIIPWLDQHDYYYGRPSLQALRDGILKSRHSVFLVTLGMLDQPRGWGIVELVLADLLQTNLVESGGVLQNVILPLFFLSPDDEKLQRSVWQSIKDRAAFHKPENGAPVAWAARKISEFLEREIEYGLDLTARLHQDSRFRTHLEERHGLVDRITARYPSLALPLLVP